MQIFKICCVSLQPFAFVSFVQCVIKITLKLTKNKQLKYKLTNDRQTNMMTADPINSSAPLSFGHRGDKNIFILFQQSYRIVCLPQWSLQLLLLKPLYKNLNVMQPTAEVNLRFLRDANQTVTIHCQQLIASLQSSVL